MGGHLGLKPRGMQGRIKGKGKQYIHKWHSNRDGGANLRFRNKPEFDPIHTQLSTLGSLMPITV